MASRVSDLLATVLVVVVLLTLIPDIGLPRLDVHVEFMKAFAFVLLMPAVILRAPFHKVSSSLTVQRGLLNVCLLVVFWFAYTYIHEIRIEKPDIFPDWAQSDIDPMERMMEGVPLWVGICAACTVTVMLLLNWNVWGAGIAGVALACLGYLLLAAFGTQQGWFTDSKFLSYQAAVTDPLGELHKWLIVGDDHSLLGKFPDVLLTIVVPFVLLGSLFSATGGGRSLIKLAFKLSRNLRGGPAHAAIMSSSIFGTMSGGPIINVLATGVLTIPMMLKRRFTRLFAGGVESAASSGGQIVPPVIGVAAFFLADFTGVAYSLVVIAAIIPALLYYFTLFVSVAIEARKLELQPMGEDIPEEFVMDRQDALNLLIVFLPIVVIISVLATGAFSVAAAGMFGVASLVLISFIDPDVRARPALLLQALGDAGYQSAKIMLLFMAVAVVAASLSATGFSNSLGTLIAQIIENSLSFSFFGTVVTLPPALSLLLVLFVTMLLALVLGMGMPTLPAYINVTIVMSGVLGSIGLSVFAANMFVFYFAVAAAITPPVAIAAFAAASITNSDPLKTGFMSLRLGVAMFIVPFVFAFYPEILVIDAAFVADSTTGTLMASRPDGFEWAQFLSILPRVLLAIFLLATAFAAYDFRPISKTDQHLRFILIVPMLLTVPWVCMPACILALMLLVRSYRRQD
ncbi:MAG: TRAP transporter fused permease subunit [Pseudomonadota bacterium]